MRKLIYIIVCLITTATWSQVRKDRDTIRRDVEDSIAKPVFFFDGDSLPRNEVELEPVFIFQPLRFNSYNEKLRYYILRKKTLKVYPYAKMAAERLTDLNDRLSRIRNRSDRNRYTRIVQRFIEDEFSAELKKLTRTEGQILVKLIYRQTGVTTFDLVKELRSGWRAFWYNTTAKMFDISLKEVYDPDNVHEDYLIEDILQRAFASNRLEKQESALDFDYANLSNKWRDSTLHQK
ncbi:DUF4294 domain-containing protein [Robertkochia solimangrovi]|uniref:DUF4294 domain-containing protein n=1 Tax=Robertkochia solimangrovi TaxID=2213046 RepID=UPI00117C419D|nr:DUF4294 domain-containing protein [Robertkochia solimangrovi]TRZ41099.1 DUF4294 domain-containing protein [Robertkochia solimangrovi]